MKNEVIVEMYDDEHFPIPVKRDRNNGHMVEKYRIEEKLWKEYIRVQKLFNKLVDKVIDERVKIVQASVRDKHGDYDD